MITKLADFSGICKFGSAKSCLSHGFFPLFGQFELSSTLQSVKMARQWGMDLRDYVLGTGSLQRSETVAPVRGLQLSMDNMQRKCTRPQNAPGLPSA